MDSEHPLHIAMCYTRRINTNTPHSPKTPSQSQAPSGDPGPFPVPIEGGCRDCGCGRCWDRSLGSFLRCQKGILGGNGIDWAPLPGALLSGYSHTPRPTDREAPYTSSDKSHAPRKCEEKKKKKI